MNQSRPRISLVHKALILTFVPLMLQIVLISNLSMLLRQSAAVKTQDTRIQACAELRTQMPLCVETANEYLIHPNRAALNDYKRQSEKLKAILQQLASPSTAAKNAAPAALTVMETERFKQSQREATALFEQIDRKVSSLPISNDSATDGLRPATVATPLVRLDGALRGILLDYSTSAEHEAKVTAEHRKEFNLWILGAVAADAMLAILLSAIFVLGITRRLTLLQDDLQLFSLGRTLRQPPAGNDELARVEIFFYEMAQRLRELERLKQDFVAMVTHDLRTPLTSIKLFQELLRNNVFGALPQKADLPLASAERSVARLLNLVNDLLDFEQLSAGQMKFTAGATSITRIVELAVDSVAEFARKKNVAIAKHLLTAPDFDDSLIADEARLVQVLVNLISNGIKFSQPGAVVTIDTSEPAPGWLQVNVTDTGRGIPETALESIFERYKQVELKDATEKQGTGLGLPISKAIVEQHGGSIGVVSRFGNGSRFSIRLPRNPAITRFVHSSTNHQTNQTEHSNIASPVSAGESE